MWSVGCSQPYVLLRRRNLARSIVSHWIKVPLRAHLTSAFVQVSYRWYFLPLQAFVFERRLRDCALACWLVLKRKLEGAKQTLNKFVFNAIININYDSSLKSAVGVAQNESFPKGSVILSPGAIHFSSRSTSIKMLVYLLATMAFTAVAASRSLADSSFDFIVVGGGTSGLVVANRLSESPDVQVLVIEAGYSALDNENSTFPELSGSMETIDWHYQSAPQIYAYDRIEPLPGGRGIGGSSLINGLSCAIISIPVKLTIDAQAWCTQGLRQLR